MSTLSATNVLRIAAVTTAAIAMLFGLFSLATMQKAETVFSPLVTETIPELVEIERLGIPAFEAATIAARIIAAPTDEAALMQIDALGAQIDLVKQAAKSPMFGDLSVMGKVPEATALVDRMREVAHGHRELYSEAQKKISNQYAETQLLRESFAQDLALVTKDIHSGGALNEQSLFDLNVLTSLIGELREIQATLEHLSNFETMNEVKIEESLIKIHVNDLFLKISRVSNIKKRDDYARQSRKIFIGFFDGSAFSDAIAAGRARAVLVSSATDIVELLNSIKFEMAGSVEAKRIVAIQHASSMRQEFTQARARIMFASFVAVLAILGLVFVTIEYRIVRRLHILDRQVAAISQGDLSAQPRVGGHDELSKLSQAVEELRSANRSQKRTEQNLRIATERAEQASKLKSDFLSMMSHEVRTPLNAIMGILELIENAPDNKRNKIRAHHGRSAAEGMFVMLSKVLDAARLESGQAEVVKTDVDVDQIRRYIEGFLEGAISKSGAQIAGSVVFDASLPKTISTDEGFLKQILANLLDNAVRFTEVGSVTVRAHAQHTGTDAKIVFEIQDTGVGIDPENSVVIFDQFRQLDQGITRKKGGSGLGLTITKNLVEQLDGVIECKGASECGAKFVIEFPLKYSKGDENAEYSQGSSG